MNLGDVTAVEATPLQLAFDGFATAFGHLLKVVDDGGLAGLDAHGLIGFLQDYESVRNRMSVIDHAAIRAGVDADLPHVLCQRSMGRVLTQALRISVPEAGRRVRAAEQLADRVSMTGEPLAPLRPRLAAAQRGGGVTPEQVAVVDAALRSVDGRGFDPAEVDAGEQILTAAAADLGPADLRQVAQQVVDAIDPDGTLPDDRLQQDRRFFRFRRAADGSFRGEFRLTPEAGAKLKAVLDPLAAPTIASFLLVGQPDAASGDAHADAAGSGDRPAADATGVEDVAAEGAEAEAGGKVSEPDPRTLGQRWHDAVEAVCDRLLRSGVLPDSGGTPAAVIVTIDADRLRSRTGVGCFSDGTPVQATTVAELADQADLAWCVKNTKGAVLALGRDRRLASPVQTLGLIARDGGCSFPHLRYRAGMVRTAPHLLDRRRHHRSRQYDVAVQIPSPLFREPGLDLPDECRPIAGMDPADMDRPAPTPDPAPPDQNPPLATTITTSRPRTTLTIGECYA